MNGAVIHGAYTEAVIACIGINGTSTHSINGEGICGSTPIKFTAAHSKACCANSKPIVHVKADRAITAQIDHCTGANTLF